MKNKKLQNLTLVFLILLSLASYVYINTAQVTQSEAHRHSIQADEEYEDAKPEVMLPDVRVIKKIMEKGRDLLPAS